MLFAGTPLIGGRVLFAAPFRPPWELSAELAVTSFRPLPEISSSGNVIRKRVGKVVPKYAPSTAWNRELGGT